MRLQIDCVAHFMKTMGIQVYQPERPILSPEEQGVVSAAEQRLAELAKDLDTAHEAFGTVEMMRIQGMVEELAEFAQAVLDRDEVDMLDALGDLLYFVLGTAVALDLPIEEAFAEIHLSNMTKQREPATEGDRTQDRLRTKGTKYESPDLDSIMIRHRKNKLRKVSNPLQVFKDAINQKHSS